MHRDIKPANVFVDYDGSVRVSNGGGGDSLTRPSFIWPTSG